MRRLRKEEYDLILALLSDQPNTKHLIEVLPNVMVDDMSDGGMGSLRFITQTDKKKVFGKQLAEITLLDADTVPVSFALNLDTEGDIFELDVFKSDFSPLKKFPLPPYNPIE